MGDGSFTPAHRLRASLLRGVERVTGRIIIGTVLIVLGVYLITALGR